MGQLHWPELSASPSSTCCGVSVLQCFHRLECDGLPPHGGSSAGCRWRTKLASRPVSASAEAGTADDWQYSCQASPRSQRLPQVAQLCAAWQPNTLCTSLRQAGSSCRRSSRKGMVSDAEQGQPAPAHLAQGRTTITAHCKLQEMSCPLLQCIFGTPSLAVNGMAAEETHRVGTFRHLRHGGPCGAPWCLRWGGRCQPSLRIAAAACARRDAAADLSH